nr:class I SAM-dependent methyltransferase [candidate division Zixibacteria bacterium]
MDIKKYTEANREAWNEVTPIHRKARRVDLKEAFRKKGFSTLDDIVTLKFKELGIADKNVAQVCCNNGRELLSMLNLGAVSGVGFDISDEAIAEACELAEISGLNGHFVRTDIYDIGPEYNAAFDLIYISIGALPWMPDLERFFTVVAGMLKSGGFLVIYEQHPLVYMLALQGDKEFDKAEPARLVHSYFREEPWVENTGIDYIGKSRYSSKTMYNFTQPLYKIMNAIIRNGITITEFNEYAHDISSEFEHLLDNGKLPLSCLLICRKE